MPPEYHSQAFWEIRFRNETHFEWLGDGQDSIMPPLLQLLDLLMPNGGPGSIPRVLHIGAGTSTLQNYIRDTCFQRYGPEMDCSRIVNVDFSEALVQRRTAQEEDNNHVKASASARTRMRWIRADMLKWSDLASLAEDGLFDLVVDKSTCDAIACGDAVQFGLQSSKSSVKDFGVNPLVVELSRRIVPAETDAAGSDFTLSPMEVLALHLASLVRPGGAWIALSYSGTRFSFIETSEEPASPNRGGIGRFWSIASAKPVDAPTGQNKAGVHAPPVQHFVYVLRRSTA